MKWTLLWVADTEDRLADIWLQAEDRQAITLATDRIERELRHNPEHKGEEFYGDRIFQYGPLAVIYQLRPDDLQVRIIQVMRIKE
jgi:hypothetical protein